MPPGATLTGYNHVTSASAAMMMVMASQNHRKIFANRLLTEADSLRHEAPSSGET